jgi:hypothetical protein
LWLESASSGWIQPKLFVMIDKPPMKLLRLLLSTVLCAVGCNDETALVPGTLSTPQPAGASAPALPLPALMTSATGPESSGSSGPAGPATPPAKLTAAFGNPSPLSDDLVLPMPSGTVMAFRPVATGADRNSFSARVYKIGDRAEGGYQEFPTDISLSGSLLATVDGKETWVYHLAKYEITEAQWHAVMESGTPDEKISLKPKTSISLPEIAVFIDRYNQWLFSNAPDSLPRHRGKSCFLRLPIETEWEFAARGGIKVSANEFDRKHPYGGDLKKFEWFSGPSSSNNKVKPVGKLLPNPLGLYDMIGNVAEITGTPYSIEYYQGRVGGVVCRGGDVFTSEPDLRSSMRNEFTPYTDELKPRRSNTIGFRLVVGSPVFTDFTADQTGLEKEWDEYRTTRSVPTLASPSAPNKSAQAGKRITELEARLASIRTLAENPQVPEDLKNALGLALGAARNIQADANALETILTSVSAESAFLHLANWYNALKEKLRLSLEFQALEKSFEIATLTKNGVDAAIYSKRLQGRPDMIQNQELAAKVSCEKYGEDIRRMGNMSFDRVTAALRSYREVNQMTAANNIISALLDHIEKHCADFSKTQRVNHEAYRADLETIIESLRKK